jgi:hypothetical protein
MGKFAGTAVLLGAVIAGYFAYAGAFYPTGRQYYEVCWDKWHSDEKRTSYASDPYRDVIWSNCEPIARRVIFEAGMIFGVTADLDDDDDADDLALWRACPKTGDTLFIMTLDRLQANGGLNITDAVTPVEWMVGRVVRTIWPDCDAERRKQGYPKMVERNGRFDWAQKCTQCEASQRRKETRKEEEETRKEEACTKTREAAAAEANRWTVVAPSKVQFLNPKIPGAGQPGITNLMGAIKNNAVVPISAVELNMALYDCPTHTSAQAECSLIIRKSALYESKEYAVYREIHRIYISGADDQKLTLEEEKDAILLSYASVPEQIARILEYSRDNIYRKRDFDPIDLRTSDLCDGVSSFG